MPPRRVKRRASPAGRRALALLRLIVDSLRRSARTVERTTGITNAQLFLVQQVGDQGPLSVNALAALARTDHSTVSTVVRRLVKARLVTKLRSRTDGRSVVVSLTAAGRRVLRRAPAPPTAHLISAVERLSERDAQDLARGLRALARRLDLASGRPAMLFEDPNPRRSSTRKAR